MNPFNFQTELQRIITQKELIEITLHGGNDMRHLKGYLIQTNQQYILIASLTNDLTLQGLSLFLWSDVESIQTETKFLRELIKGNVDMSLHQMATAFANRLTEFSFLGFISALEGSQSLATITTQTENYTGRIYAHDEEILVIDEYYAEDDGRFARTYINPSLITSITTGGAWLGLIERSLSEK